MTHSIHARRPADDTPDEGLDPRVERTRAAALTAAFALLTEHGPDAVTHGQVAAAARVSRTTLYKHWPTRTDLLRAVFDSMTPTELTEPTGDLRADLRELVGELATDLCDPDRSRLIAAVMERATIDPTLSEVRDGILRETMDYFTMVIAHGIATGELRAGIDIDLAFAALAGTFLFKRYMVGDPIPPDQVDRVIDAFIENHAAR